MLNDFIVGGQVFLHKVRMFVQVFNRSFHISLLLGVFIAVLVNWSSLYKLEWDEFLSYRKAKTAIAWDDAINVIRSSIGKDDLHVSYIDAKYKGKAWKKVNPSKLVKISMFKQADDKAFTLFKSILVQSGFILLSSFILIFWVWNRFGVGLKSEKKQAGTGLVLTAKQVRDILKTIGKISNYYVGGMPLVKDMEMRHFLVTGATGSGKTNLIQGLLLQVEKQRQPAVVIDQTGEMISKYYDPSRGDIIFNPFDARGSAWDFWQDCSNEIELERFSKILMGFSRKSSSTHSDPFWENAATSVFNGCIEFLRKQKNDDVATTASMKEIVDLVCNADIGYLKNILQNTEAGRYLGKDSKQTAESIISVLTASAKPLKFLVNDSQEEGVNQRKSFSIKQYFEDLKNGSSSWLFLATKPSNRSLTLPLIACMSELALSQLMEIGISKDRRIWVVLDEIASLGKLPALSPLMAEGRKYGACVVAGMQSLNQIYEHYGQYSGSSIFGQFGTSFFFRNNEPAIAKMVSTMCGSETITRQQKNTSFGANEYRDGVSYNEQQQKKLLVEIEDLASLAIGECYAILPEPAVRLSKIHMDEIKINDKCEGFIQREENSKNRKEVSYDLLDIKQKEEREEESDNKKEESHKAEDAESEDIAEGGSTKSDKSENGQSRNDSLIDEININADKIDQEKENKEITVR